MFDGAQWMEFLAALERGMQRMTAVLNAKIIATNEYLQSEEGKQMVNKLIAAAERYREFENLLENVERCRHGQHR